MALIAHFIEQSRERYTTHHPIDATYYVLGDGEAKLLQIDTSGRSDRENPGKLSQTIQLDKSSARALFDIIGKEFGFK